MRLIATFALLLFGTSLRVAADEPLAAQIGDRPITLKTLDEAGGRAVHDAQQGLYQARLRAMYEVLSTELISLEAKSRGINEQELTEREITSKITPVTEGDIDAFLQGKNNINPTDPRFRKQAEDYLKLTRQDAARRQLLSTLISKYKVKITLEAPGPAPREIINGAESPFLGAADAPVKIVVFSDYKCPYCRDLSQDLASLLEKYPKDLKVIYRHFPVHPLSEDYAKAALCAGSQGAFEQFHKALFAAPGLSTEQLDPLASSLHLDLTQFHTCLASKQFDARIADDQNEGRRLGVEGTPSVFVNGERFRGSPGLARLTAVIDKALQASKVKTAQARP